MIKVTLIVLDLRNNIRPIKHQYIPKEAKRNIHFKNTPNISF